MPGPYEPNFRKGVFSTLALVADHAQEGAPVIGILGGLDAFRAEAIDDAHHAAAQLGFRNYDFHRIGGGAVNVADFRHVFDASQDVDGVAFAHHGYENVAGGDGRSVADGELLELVIVAIGACQAGAGRLIERDAEFHLRHAGGDGFVHVLDGLDEVSLPEDQIHAVWYFERHGLQFHKQSSA